MFPVGNLSKETDSHTSTIVDLSLEVFKTFGARHQWECGEVENTEPAGVRLFVFPLLLPIFCSFVEEEDQGVVCVCVFLGCGLSAAVISPWDTRKEVATGDR